MGVFFSAMGLTMANSVRHAGDMPARPMLAFLGLFLAMIVFNIAALLWFRRRLIKDFIWDGRALRFHTLGVEQEQLRDIAEFSWLRDWSGRGGRIGYRIRFRDGQKVYLDITTPNAAAAAQQMQARIDTSRFG
jgi:hypothetical protein